jgi:two-component system chemotaxis sensor kinase CheA
MSDDIDLSQFHQAFFEEAQEHLATMEELLMSLDLEDPDDEEIAAIFRSAHSIKGSAGTFGFLKVQDVTHVLESILDRVRNGTSDITSERSDLFLEAGDILKDLIECHEEGEDIDEESADSIIERLTADLKELEGGDSSSKVETKSEDTGDLANNGSAPGDFGMFGDDPEPLANNGSEPGDFGMFGADEPEPLANNGSEPGDFGMFGSDEPEPLANNGSEPGDFGMFPESAESPENIFAEVEAEKKEEAKPQAKKKPKAAKKKKAEKPQVEKTIRVGVDKIDQLINSIGEMVITQSVIALNSGMDAAEADISEIQIDVKKLHESIHTLQRNVKDLQDTIMSIRMVSINTVFNKYPRLVRDMSKKLNKNIELKMTGENTELDKGLIEKLSDPLTHILRNSIDHGIEEIEERALTDKKEVATIHVSAAQVGGNVQIEITDDGRGLNREKILSKAKSSGLNVSDSMPDSEVWLLIFAPGFSTADVVSELSGRGVGMDVVKKNISGMGGKVELQSKGGEGTKLTIYLPLTMAILNGMIVRNEGVSYIVPMLSIIETLKPDLDKIKPVGGTNEAVMEIRGEHIPVIDLEGVFALSEDSLANYKENSSDFKAYYKNKIMMLIEAEDKKALIVMDELVGQQQVVIKDLEDNFKKITGISGATILGDGNVALIIDINYFVDLKNRDLIELDNLRIRNKTLVKKNLTKGDNK